MTATEQTTGPASTSKSPFASNKLAARNRDWLELKEGLKWPYAKIAKTVGKSPRAVKAAIASARRETLARNETERNTNEVREIIEYVQGHPLYRAHPEVIKWLDAQRARASA